MQGLRLDIAEAGFRTVGRDAEGQQIAACGHLDGARRGLLECRRLLDQVVGGHHQDGRVLAVRLGDAERGDRDGRRGIAPVRLQHEARSERAVLAFGELVAAEAGRQFVKEAYVDRRNDLAASRRKLGIIKETVTLNHTPIGDAVCVTVLFGGFALAERYVGAQEQPRINTDEAQMNTDLGSV